VDYFTVVLNSDQVNRQDILVPASALAGGIIDSVESSIRNGLPLGMPSHFAHDLHRPWGWCVNIGVHMSGNIARHIGYVLAPTTESERSALQRAAEQYWECVRQKNTVKFETELRAKVGAAGARAPIDFLGAAVLRGEGLAAGLYPNLFSANSDLVDKDGLVDYRALLADYEQVQPGVFRDETRDLLIFAHPFFRRSLSRRNNLNAYFLQALTNCAARHSNLRIRLRLDPNMVGHPESARSAIELEYWHGPHFSSEIATIPDGVAEHKASERIRIIEGVDKTQFWWKAPESRKVGTDVSAYRTFEVEELIDNPSYGISDRNFGCRYAHAEFSVGQKCISHFDGAIRNYEADAFLRRVDLRIDRAGKQTTYTKLFRFDGALPVEDWKALCTDFFRGNNLVPEYFSGALSASLQSDTETADNEQISSAGAATFRLGEPTLAALVSFDRPSDQNSIYVVADEPVPYEGEIVHCVELPPAALRSFLFGLIDLKRANLVEFPGTIANVPRIVLGRHETMMADWHRIVSELVTGLRADHDAGLLTKASVAVAWPSGSCQTTLSVAGPAMLVADLLADAETIVDPQRPAALWIEKFKSLVVARSSIEDGECNPTDAMTRDGLLRLDRDSNNDYPSKLYLAAEKD
jgi:hypothetical protein